MNGLLHLKVIKFIYPVILLFQIEDHSREMKIWKFNKNWQNKSIQISQRFSHT